MYFGTFKMTKFTYRILKFVKVPNTLSCRNAIVFDDKSLENTQQQSE